MEFGSAEPEAAVAPEPNQAPEFPQYQEKVPLLKREIHFRKPKAEKQPKPEKQPMAKKEPKEKTPLLKRELHLRKSKAEPDELGSAAAVPMLELPSESNQVPEFLELHSEPAQELEVEATLAASVEMVSGASPVSDTSSDPAPAPKEKVPLLKRELHLRKPKSEKTPKQKAAKSSEDAAHKVTRVIGLRIGSSQISAAHVRNNGSAELVQLARTPIEPGLVVGGEVRDADGLTHALKEFFAKNKLPRKDVRLGIASNRIGVRILEVPAIDDPKQFKNALRFRAQELLPIPIVDAILDHVIIDNFVGPEGEAMHRVLLVFAHRELVSRFVDVCKGAGVRLAGIDLEPFALLRSVAEPRSESGDAIVAVSIGHDRTIVAVSDGNICDFVRVLDWGGASLDVAIARALNLAPSQAEPLKHGLALDATEPPDGITPVQLELVKAAAKAEIASLGRELVSSLRFYQARPGSLAIGEVLLTGGAAQLGGMADELQRHLGAPVRLADPLARVNVPRKFKLPEHPGALAVAIGLGVED
jgi:type IV pilus assembly protein PilM